MKFIPNCIPSIAGNEKKYLNDCIDTGWLSSVGPYVNRFEDEFSAYLGIEKSVAVSSGTSAIHLGLKCLDVKENDYVLCPSIDFVGGINPIYYLKANPIFIDSDDYLNLDIKKLEYFLKNQTRIKNNECFYKKDNRRIRAIIVVHLYGNPVNMEKILDLSKKFHLKILEDAAESLGAKYKNKYVGLWGDVGCFSFNGNKVITCGGGGMIVSKHNDIIERCKHISNQAKIDKFEFIHDEIGFNYRLTNISAAVGIAQLEKINKFIKSKRKFYKLYNKYLKNSKNWKIIKEPKNSYGTYWMILVKYIGDKPKYIFDEIKTLASKGIGIRPVWYPAHNMDLYKNEINYCSDSLLVKYYTYYCLPSSTSLTEIEIEKVCRVLNKI